MDNLTDRVVARAHHLGPSATGVDLCPHRNPINLQIEQAEMVMVGVDQDLLHSEHGGGSRAIIKAERGDPCRLGASSSGASHMRCEPERAVVRWINAQGTIVAPALPKAAGLGVGPIENRVRGNDRLAYCTFCWENSSLKLLASLNQKQVIWSCRVTPVTGWPKTL
jgi:hypothetical protein